MHIYIYIYVVCIYIYNMEVSKVNGVPRNHPVDDGAAVWVNGCEDLYGAAGGRVERPGVGVETRGGKRGGPSTMGTLW